MKEWRSYNWSLRFGMLLLAAFVAGGLADTRRLRFEHTVDWVFLGLAVVLVLIGVWTELRRRHAAG